ncbi:LysR substrate-binding domain-containing protein [Piscirickettsia litoralis]|uniref:LysR family transcriptional regulator n=1 Tax=Piscirickettsia litoralis TaxID=1891921 RepID=A0ABX3A2R1_9GAMM|nr:LysR substrate-binding domain-containing protein [Piscirickettsia litoralis]ODN43123.1 LysR family transcriptional regulator [Piscirickettsia litoralis]
MDWHKCAQSFIQIVEDQSFAKAARSLYSSSSALSKHINWLEDQLGVQLLQRTTRRLDLTAEGECFYRQAKQLLNEWEQLKETVCNKSNEPRGMLTVGISVVFGNRYIIPLLPELLALYPQLKINVKTLTYPVLHNIENLDLYFSHKPPDFFSSNMDHHTISDAYLQMFASPDYLAEYGTPSQLADLKGHNCLLSTGNDTPNRWEFENGKSVQVQGNLIADNNGALIKAAVAGLGIIFTSPLAFANELKGSLVPVLPELHSPRWAIYAYYPKRKTLPLKTQAFLNYIEEKLQDILPVMPIKS